MIVFLNFAPIEFMGGAEKWIWETAKLTSAKEKTTIVTVDRSISDRYAKLVLKREFEERVDVKNKDIKRFSLKKSHFIPFSNDYKKAKTVFNTARMIYFKFDILEVGILFYFCGFSVFPKLIAGVHSPLIYTSPIRFFDRLHNFLYASNFMKFILKKFNRIHTITIRDQQFLHSIFGLKNVFFIPNSFRIKEVFNQNRETKDDTLHILFVGELSQRKGIDILTTIIETSSNDFTFHIAGNGPHEEVIKELGETYRNCTYYGFLQKPELMKLYSKVDVLLLPARAEGFPLVFHEALKAGLPIVDSHHVHVGLPNHIEYSVNTQIAEDYADVLDTILRLKRKKKLSLLNKSIKHYYEEHLDAKVINKKILNQFWGARYA